MSTLEHSPPEPTPPSPSEDAHRFLGELISTKPLLEGQFKAATEARVEKRRCEETEEQAKEVEEQAREIAANTHRTEDPKGTGFIPRWLACSGAAGFVGLDWLPSFWAAQSFNLDLTDTYGIAALILVAQTGAMVVLERGKTTVSHRFIQVIVGIGFALLFILRCNYLTVTGASLPSALLEAAAMTGISALNVVFGSLVLRHRVRKPVARDDAAAGRAKRHLVVATEAANEARGDSTRKDTAFLQTVHVEGMVRLPESGNPIAFTDALAKGAWALLDVAEPSLPQQGRRL